MLSYFLIPSCYFDFSFDYRFWFPVSNPLSILASVQYPKHISVPVPISTYGPNLSFYITLLSVRFNISSKFPVSISSFISVIELFFTTSWTFLTFLRIFSQLCYFRVYSLSKRSFCSIARSFASIACALSRLLVLL